VIAMAGTFFALFLNNHGYKWQWDDPAWIAAIQDPAGRPEQHAFVVHALHQFIALSGHANVTKGLEEATEYKAIIPPHPQPVIREEVSSTAAFAGLVALVKRRAHADSVSDAVGEGQQDAADQVQDSAHCAHCKARSDGVFPTLTL
jgi:hypothetical protein